MYMYSRTCVGSTPIAVRLLEAGFLYKAEHELPTRSKRSVLLKTTLSSYLDKVSSSVEFVIGSMITYMHMYLYM